MLFLSRAGLASQAGTPGDGRPTILFNASHREALHSGSGLDKLARRLRGAYKIEL